MKKTILTLMAVALALSAGNAMACKDVECPHDPPKPPKRIVSH